MFKHGESAREPGAARYLAALGVCLASLTLGHDAAYWVAMGAAHQHADATLHMHEYLPVIIRSAVIVALLGCSVWAVVAFRAARAGRVVASLRHTSIGAGWVPAVILPGAFIVMEFVERQPFGGGVPPWEILVVGCCIQIAAGMFAGRIVGVMLDGARAVAILVARGFQHPRYPQRSPLRCGEPGACNIALRGVVILPGLMLRGPPYLNES